MKIIEPKVELWQQGDDSKAHVASYNVSKRRK